MRNLFSVLFGCGLGGWMMYLYMPTSQHAVKIGFILGLIFFLLGVVNLLSGLFKRT